MGIGKISIETIRDLYDGGKRVYLGQASLSDTVNKVLEKYPNGINKTSAEYYIRLVEEYINGKGSTWNQNSDLVLYYVESILNDFGIEAGRNAYFAALKFTKTKNRENLEKRVQDFWAECLDMSFEDWLKHCRPNGKEYTRNTVMKYSRALKNAGDWLGIQLEVPIYEIDNVQQFIKVKKEILSLPNFSEVNESHGDGDLSAALTHYERYLLFREKGIPEMQVDYADSGEVSFEIPDSFNSTESRRFVNSLLAKPFVILTGNSGTGKTRIATRFAKYMGVQLEDGKNYELVSVGADWTDNTAILGYFNPMGDDGAGKYVETAILKLFVRAKNNPQYPFFLILDEMNLSHVERYFADFLSHMETPETAFKIENYSDEEFTYPDNLFVIGTVNIDETTYMFSPKVLDRANVIEFKPDKESIFGMFAKQDFDDSIDTADDETIQAFMSLARKIREDGYEKDLTGEADAFRQIYDILEENGFEFAYRTVKEICRYIYAANEIADAFGYNMNNTIDEQIVQKLLPKIYGNRRAIGDMLEKLAKIFEEKQYNLSLTKVRQMQRKLDNTQYVSFI